MARTVATSVPRRSYSVLVEPFDPAVPVELPARATPASAGFDLRSSVDVRLTRGKVTRVATGLKVRAPPGTFLEVRPRSGLATKGVLMPNAPGTIDRDYAGELQVPLTYLFAGGYRIATGDRIAQLRLVEELPATFRWGTVADVEGRTGGFGSTGR
jgi:dUTP pyrophosphatase